MLLNMSEKRLKHVSGGDHNLMRLIMAADVITARSPLITLKYSLF